MEKYIINGGRKISGKLNVQRAKNAVLPMLAGAILTEEEVVIQDCPKILDVMNMINILRALGVSVKFDENHLIVNAKGLNSCSVSSELCKELRSSIFLMGALVARTKKAKISFPGGCDIGARPIDLHIKALNSLNVDTVIENGDIKCSTGKIKGAKITLDFPSVGATENAMLCAVLGEGKTEIHNSAREPEIVDLMKFLNSMGAKVFGAGTSIILIEGVKKLNGTTYKPMGDRIEAGTYMLASVITGGELEICGINHKNICSLIHKLCDNTCKITIKNDIIYLKSGAVKKPFNVDTMPYPGYPTDLQAQTMSLLSVSDGESKICESVFERRFSHVEELKKLGANIFVSGREAIIHGVKRLHGANVTAKDLRGGAGLVVAALNAEGVTEINGVSHIERGYLDMPKKLIELNADIKAF